MAPPPTQRAYWDDTRRRTALAQVTGHLHGGFLLDRTLFHAPDPSYHHKQPCDRGHILADGHKLKIHKAAWERTRETHALVHRTDGPIPPPGAKAQLHLDSDRRDQQARAHAVMHLLTCAILDERHELVTMPEIVGGGQINLHARLRDKPEDALARIHKNVQATLERRIDITPQWCPRDETPRRVTHHPIALDAIAPHEPTLRLVKIGEHCTLPCDAPLPPNTRDIGALSATPPRITKDGLKWSVRVAAP